MIKTYPKGSNVQLSPNFNTRKFDCHCTFKTCKTTKVDELLVTRLQRIRDTTGRSVTIDSGYRCKKYNASIPNSASQSMHTTGRAADIKIEGVMPDCVQKEMKANWFKNGGVGVYHDFTHGDTGPQRTWTLSQPEPCNQPFPINNDDMINQQLQQEVESLKTQLAEHDERINDYIAQLKEHDTRINNYKAAEVELKKKIRDQDVINGNQLAQLSAYAKEIDELELRIKQLEGNQPSRSWWEKFIAKIH